MCDNVHVTVFKAGHPGVPSYIHVCLFGLWLGGLLHLSFLSYFFKLVCYAHVFPCTYYMCGISLDLLARIRNAYNW